MIWIALIMPAVVLWRVIIVLRVAVALLGIAIICDDEVRDDLGETRRWREECCAARKGKCGWCPGYRCEAFGGCYSRLAGTTYPKRIQAAAEWRTAHGESE